jgi:LiaF transmembrane domain
MSKESVLKVEESRMLQRTQTWPAYGVIAIGVALLITNLFGFPLINILWPGFVLAPGLILLWPAYSSTPEQQNRLGFLAVPGAILVTVGTLLFIMNLTNHFEAWAYSWPLLLAAVGWGLMYMKRFEPEHRVHQNGYTFVRLMVLMAMGFAVFFELIIFGGFSPLLPLVIIGFGVYLLLKDRRVGSW